MPRNPRDDKAKLFIADGLMVMDRDEGITVDGKDIMDLIANQLGEPWRSRKMRLGRVKIWIHR